MRKFTCARTSLIYIWVGGLNTQRLNSKEWRLLIKDKDNHKNNHKDDHKDDYKDDHKDDHKYYHIDNYKDEQKDEY